MFHVNSGSLSSSDLFFDMFHVNFHEIFWPDMSSIGSKIKFHDILIVSQYFIVHLQSMIFCFNFDCSKSILYSHLFDYSINK